MQASESRQTDVSDSLTVVSSIESLQQDVAVSAAVRPQQRHLSDCETAEDNAPSDDIQGTVRTTIFIS